MGFKDLQAWFSGLFSGGGKNTSSRRPDGGTSCYRPVQRRNPQEEALAREKAAEYAAQQPQVAYAHSGFTGMNPPDTGSFGFQSAWAADPYGDGSARAATAAYAPARGGFQPAAGSQAPAPGSNISYMPGAGAPDTAAPVHVEHILAITSLRSCYEAIECMKNGETLIVTLDVLGSEGERIRCQDMLAGAAFTLRCSVRTLPSAGVVVIVPAGVKILPEQSSFAYARTEEAAAPAREEEYIPRRERRVSQNPVGWTDAAAGQGYNPYTGSMPAAAGDYGIYGGY